MCDTSIPADEGLLSKLKEFIIKEISLICTFQDHLQSMRPSAKRGTRPLVSWEHGVFGSCSGWWSLGWLWGWDGIKVSGRKQGIPVDRRRERVSSGYRGRWVRFQWCTGPGVGLVSTHSCEKVTGGL